ncbi:DUF3800 domain-containing protein [Bacillus taeanensis]|nr:DUF3800 domain-containing protein [Bacillus taeanensis]
MFLIFFDESGKLDDDSTYSYYGAFGASQSTLKQIENDVKQVYQSLNTKSEMHFSKLKDDKYMNKYFHSLSKVLTYDDIYINIFIVNNNEAKLSAEKLRISISELRSLLYVKIPERLYYGMTRRLQDISSINIYVDENEEYAPLYEKIQDQMNAHAVYRKKGYKIEGVEPLDSETSIPLQVIDVFLGMVGFLIEENYFPQTRKLKPGVSKQIQSELIYRLLTENDYLKKLQEKVTLYKWEGDNEELDKLPFSNFISRFLVYKTQFDIQEMNRLQKILLENENIEDTKQLRKLLGYGNSQVRTFLGYKNEIEGRGRNYKFI